MQVYAPVGPCCFSRYTWLICAWVLPTTPTTHVPWALFDPTQSITCRESLTKHFSESFTGDRRSSRDPAQHYMTGGTNQRHEMIEIYQLVAVGATWAGVTISRDVCDLYSLTHQLLSFFVTTTIDIVQSATVTCVRLLILWCVLPRPLEKSSICSHKWLCLPLHRLIGQLVCVQSRLPWLDPGQG